MWISWTLICVAQVWTNRYLKHHWKWRQAAHTTLGVLSLLLTLAATLIILDTLHWEFEKFLHNVLGAIFMVFCQLLILSGIFAIANRRFGKHDWK